MFSPSVIEIEEEKKELPVTTTIVVDESSHIDAAQFSSVKKLIRVTGWILRYVSNLKRALENRKMDQELSLEEVVNAETFWIKKIQEERFPAELAELCKGNNVSKTLPIFPQRPILDNDIIRVPGRIEYAFLAEDQLPPILLPANHNCVHLLIRDVHQKIKHFGVNGTLAEQRDRFWIQRGR